MTRAKKKQGSHRLEIPVGRSVAVFSLFSFCSIFIFLLFEYSFPFFPPFIFYFFEYICFVSVMARKGSKEEEKREKKERKISYQYQFKMSQWTAGFQLPSRESK